MQVEGLKTHFKTKTAIVRAVDGISFDLEKGECLGIVGESGSGKSVSMLSMLQLIEAPGEVLEGSVIYCDESTCSDLLSLGESEIANYRGSKIGMVYQQAISAFNPVQKLRKQLREAVIIHNKAFVNVDQYLDDLIKKVELEDPSRILNSYPHQLSGGQLQRCMIAMAIANKPNVLIADEPTTSLDVITQKEIIKLLLSLKDEFEMSMIFISHDLGVIGEVADRTVVMRNGKIVEQAITKDLFENPQSTYAKALLNCRPSLNHKTKRLPTLDYHEQSLDAQKASFQPISKDEIKERQNEINTAPDILKVSGLSKSYGIERGLFRQSIDGVRAVDNVSFNLRKGEVLGVVGESGSGKSTLAKLILNLEKADKGEVIYYDVNLLSLNQKQMRPLRKEIQIIFQDVYGSLDPRMNVKTALDIVLNLHTPKNSKGESVDHIIALLEKVGLSKDFLTRLPHELSGGERQRVCIARALLLEPKLLVCDECVSALDVSVQAQILNLLLDLRDDLELSIIFISHDLSVINFMCDRMVVMQSGKIVEEGFPLAILQNPSNEYTKKLIAAIPGQR